MPELSRFEGMVIKMLFNDTVQHNKPHVHVTYGEYRASVGIDGELLAGSLPQKQFKMLVGWLALHKMKLMQLGTKLSEANTLIRLSLYSKEEFFMFISNGIVYASERPENVQIIAVKPLDDMMMLLTFSTGEQRLFDASVLNGPAFAPLTDEKIFKDCKIVDGVVTWMDEDIDCAPEYMYEHSYAYPSLKSVI